MKRFPPYFKAAPALVLAGTLAAWPFLGGDGRAAVLWASALALGSQIPLHLALKGWRGRNDRFVAAIVLGVGSRMAVLVAAIVLFVLPGRVAAAPFLLALATFLVALSLAESILDQRRPESARA